MKSSLLIEVLALNNQYNIFDLSYKSDAGEFKYLGSHAHIILAVNATKSHLAFWIGNISLFINLSFLVFISMKIFDCTIISSSYHFDFR
ncbi:MAG: hypothetical protein Q8S84_01955 [bacterium]|nr:hypothetical protein [bacterium]